MENSTFKTNTRQKSVPIETIMDFATMVSR